GSSPGSSPASGATAQTRAGRTTAAMARSCLEGSGALFAPHVCSAAISHQAAADAHQKPLVAIIADMGADAAAQPSSRHQPTDAHDGDDGEYRDPYHAREAVAFRIGHRLLLPVCLQPEEYTGFLRGMARHGAPAR